MKKTKRIISLFLSLLLTAGVLLPGFTALQPKANAALAGNCKTGDLIYYGSYPQGEITDASSIAILAEQTPDEYGVVSYNGSRFYRYMYNNKTHFYLCEPIAWRVLSNGNDGLFVLSEKILDREKYHSTYSNVTWETCDLRKWLNKTFYDLAFNSDEKNGIRESQILNDPNPDKGTSGGNETQDHVFVLSYNEATAPDYGFPDNRNNTALRTSYCTAYALSKLGYNHYFENTWWLRTPGVYSSNACSVYNTGSLRVNPTTDEVNCKFGVCPAMKLESDAKVITADKAAGGDQLEMRVLNTAGNAIPGACVTLRDSVGRARTETTDDNGTAKFFGGGVNLLTAENLEYTVTADGYGADSSISGNRPVSLNGCMIVTLYNDQELKYKLKEAIYQDTDGDYQTNLDVAMDILKQKKRLSMSNESALFGIIETGHFTLNCKSGNTAETEKYVLYQNAEMIAESTNGEFRLRVNQFNTGNGIYVKVYSNDGKTINTFLNLEICEDAAVKKTNVKFGDKISFKLDSDIPFVGGTTLNYDIPDLPLEVYIEDGKAYVGVNMKICPEDERKTIKQQYNEIQKTIEEIKQLNYELGNVKADNIEKKIDKFLKDHDKFDLPVVGEVKMDFFGAGMIEWDSMKALMTDDVKVSLDLCLITKVNFNKNWQLMLGVFPVTIQLNFGAKAKLQAKGSFDFGSSKLEGDFAVTISPYIDAFAGVGVDRWVGFGVYGSATADINIQLIGTSGAQGLNSVDLTGELGLKGYVGPFEYKKDFAYHTWHLYSRQQGPSLAPKRGGGAEAWYDGFYDDDAYAPQDLSYLSGESGWLGGSSGGIKKAPASGAAVYNTLTPLLTSTYRNAMPVTAAAGDTAVMAFLGADETRGANNFTVLKYSVYNAAANTWCEPVVLSDDGTADYAPQLLNVGDDLYLAYQNADAVLPDDATDDDYLNAQTVAVMKYDADTGAFVPEAAFANPDASLYAPKLTSVGGAPVLVWIEAQNADLIGQAQSVSLCYAIKNGDAWGEKQTLSSGRSSLSAFAAGEENGSLAVLACADADNSFATDDDRTLLLVTPDGTAAVEEGAAAQLAFAALPDTGTPAFVWVNNGALYRLANGAPALVTDAVGSLESLVYLSDRILCTLADENGGSEVYALVYDAAVGGYGAPVPVTQQEQYIERLSGCEVGGRQLLTATQKTVTITQGDVDDDCTLCYLLGGDFTDLSLDGVNCSPADLTYGQDLPVQVSLSNNGTTTVSAAAIRFTAPDGKTAAEQTVTLDLLPGESKEVTVNCPVGVEQVTYTVTATAANDSVAANNAGSVTVGYADAEVQVEMLRIGKQNMMAVTVENTGAAPVGGVLDIYTDEHTEIPLASYPIETLGAMERQIVHYDFDHADFVNDTSVVTCVFTPDAEEAYTCNNSDTGYLEFVEFKSDVCGVAVNGTDLTVTEGETLPLTATVFPTDADDQTVSWTSADETVATVDADGTVHGVFRGETEITVTTAENGFTDTVTVTVLCAHAYDVTRTEPTCTEDGEIRSVCAKCGDVQTEVLPATGHTEETVPAVAPTCVATGLTAGKRCTVCGDITVAPQTVAANGHSFALTGQTDPNCIKAGTGYYQCTVCTFEETREIAPLGHNFVADAARSTAPTCTAPGVAAYSCTRCDATNDAVAALTGHTPVADAAVPASCLTPGKTAGSHCAVCGAVIEAQQVVPAPGHTLETLAAVPPTCTAYGKTEEVVCTVCGEVKLEGTLLPPTGHTVPAEYDCETGVVCTVCGEELTAPCAHTPETLAALEATCVAEGLTAGEKCAVCGKVLTEQTAVPASGHEYAETVTPPTCIRDGYTTLVCSRCGDVQTLAGAGYTGHSFVLTVTPATCTENGVQEMCCSVCGEEYTAVLPAAGHFYRVAVTAPTCTEEGYTEHVCLFCADTYRDEPTPAAGHSFRTEVVRPTCVSAGYTLHICTVCGYNYSDGTTPMTGHTVVQDDYVAPTADTRGLTAGSHCAECGLKLTPQLVILELDHPPVENPLVAPTCTADGYTMGSYCLDCGEVIEQKMVIPATGHSYRQTGALAPSCAADGYAEYACANCTASYWEILNKTPHADEDGDGRCDGCGELLAALSCRHLCHSENRFVQFIYRILCRFWKFFGVNETCECGAKHWD
ncbi:MAG: Ig-like domain-containing protein [Clostridia bacterium]|nr:Ig-like domain-containing protein [Clostridia bacterium]